MDAFTRGLGHKPHFHKDRGRWTWAIRRQRPWSVQACMDWCRRMNEAAK